MTIPLARFLARTSSDTLQTTWVTAAAFMILLTVLLPRRFGFVLPVLVAAGLAALVCPRNSGDRRSNARRPRGVLWHYLTSVDSDATTGPVSYFYDGAADWNAVSKIAYWNRSVTSIATLPGASLGPLPTTVVRPGAGGRLLDSRFEPLPANEIVLHGIHVRRHCNRRERPGPRPTWTPAVETARRARTRHLDDRPEAERRHSPTRPGDRLRMRPGHWD